MRWGFLAVFAARNDIITSAANVRRTRPNQLRAGDAELAAAGRVPAQRRRREHDSRRRVVGDRQEARLLVRRQRRSLRTFDGEAADDESVPKGVC